MSQEFLEDKYHRSFRKLRVSLNNVCNLACKYCIPEGIKAEELDKTFAETEEILRKVTLIHKAVNLEKVRLTGGEPMLHQGVEQLIRGFKSIGIPHVSITSNGLALDEKIDQLVVAGLDSVNISLDASNESVFEQITGYNRFARTIKSIDRCLKSGISLKLNSVILKGINESEIIPLLDYAIKHGIELRFLELMKMGKVSSYFETFYLSSEDILNHIKTKYKVEEIGRPESSTTRYFRIGESYKLGLIQNETKPFCSDCDRLRLGSDLKLYGCITAEKGVSLDDDTIDLNKALQLAMNQKQDVFIGSKRSMIKTGG